MNIKEKIKLKRLKTYKEQRILIKALKAGLNIFYEDNFDDKNGTRLAYCQIEECLTYRPAIFFNSRKPICASLIIHELIHAIRFELHNRKQFQGLDDWGDELLPYITQYCFEEIVKFCKKNKIKIVLS